MINGMMATANQSQYHVHFRPSQQEFKALGTALQSGDLTAAKNAFNSISATASKGDPAKTSTFAASLSAIGKALDSGDVAAAQKAFASVRQAVKGHRSHESATAANPAPTAPSPAPVADPDGDGDGASPAAAPMPYLNISA